ncbi:ParB N-terminal domain-containing protein [Streptomyces andamanensis]|uniref:ParB N-terminal domain-containing protein n=1 Tax=Streptomyces andamanensis TaxID=1565035 RepID=A0ABV8TCG8_9ACTN
MTTTDDTNINSLLSKVERWPLGQLKQFPGNPNEGDVDAIAESLAENGLFEPIIVQRSTGYILSHNHVTKAAERIGWSHLDVIPVDVDDVTAKKIVAAANRTAELSKRNEYLLAELLSDIVDGSDTGLEGTGYDEAFLDDLMARVEPELPDTSDDEDEGGGIVISEAGPTGAHYAETPEQEASRGARVAGEQSLAAKGLAEMVFVMDVDAKSQLLLDVEAMREHLGDQPTGPLVSAAVRIANVVLEAAHHNSPPLDWNQILGQAAVRPDTEATE